MFVEKRKLDIAAFGRIFSVRPEILHETKRLKYSEGLIRIFVRETLKPWLKRRKGRKT